VPLSVILWFRITPAPAGSTMHKANHPGTEQDHPRACGEHLTSRCIIVAVVGSPPRLRGALEYEGRQVRAVGITPAPAGSTTCVASSSLSIEDHPRACGEHATLLFRANVRIGSPPRLRGARMAQRATSQATRITPAPAGSTFVGRKASGGEKDHPRACGEHVRAEVRAALAAGITPAPAGSTLLTVGIYLIYWDHPRACGEHPLPARCLHDSLGSPPRLRGAPEKKGGCKMRKRITPAPAGSTPTR